MQTRLNLILVIHLGGVEHEKDPGVKTSKSPGCKRSLLQASFLLGKNYAILDGGGKLHDFTTTSQLMSRTAFLYQLRESISAYKNWAG